MSIRILSTSALVGPYVEQLGLDFPELVVAPYRSAAWESALLQAQALIVLLSEPLTEKDLEQCPDLRVIGTYSVGINHLPGAYCKSRGILIVNTPGVLTDATADLALALLLALTRRISEGETLVRSGNWKGWEPDLLLGSSLAGETCGILGSGPIGLAFARRVFAIGMKIVFWDRAGTHDMVTARGGIVDEDAAIDLLHDNKIGGFGLDVYDNEPDIRTRWYTAPRTVLLPHLGSATRQTRENMSRMLCDGVRNILLNH
ncbi:MAG: NAD(P)-dependent oxidoreductase [Syntrophorhabdaceae bacterium]